MSSKDLRLSAKFLLLACLLRGLWEADPEIDVRDLDINRSGQSLVKTFRSPPDSFSNNKVAKCLYEVARLHLTPFRLV